MSVSPSLADLASTDALIWTGDEPPGDADAIAAMFAAAFDGSYALAAHGTESLTLIHLDTVDARVRRAGRQVVYCAATGALVAVRADDAPVAQPIGKMRWPAELHALPEGPVRALLARPVWVRALVPYATTRSAGRTFSLLNTDDKTVARVTWWTSAVTGRQPGIAPRIHVASLRGYERDAKTAKQLLRANAPVAGARQSWFAGVLLAANGGRPDRPAGRARAEMTARQPAALAVATALLDYLDDLEANVAGAIDDVDTEFLHDLRVAVRRTRSVLKLLGDVLPDGTVSRVAPEFRWLGQITTPTRDLDVYLLGVDDMAASITNPDDLVPFAE
ncbi:MAG TPA: CHAD domain-containing protein, partial [Jatrophihabitans sp.]|nr:CHAD domain-containing protein [Jatrophihabitans sp.]